MIPRLSPIVTACVRSFAPSFSRMLPTWLFTVSSRTESWAAISLFAFPNAISFKTSDMSLTQALGRAGGLNPETSKGKAVYVIRDDGPGFDPASLPDPLDPENLEKAGGRGLLLIRTFMDEVRFRRHPDGGMEIVLKKNLGAIEKKEENPA